jgi:hypothetical protein
MKVLHLLLITCLISIFSSTIAFCEEKDSYDGPWEKYSVSLGAFLAETDTNFRVGSGVGLSLDLEKVLNFDSTNTVFRADGSWRFTKNRRHRLDLSWFAFRYSGTKQAESDIGDEITKGQTLDGYFDFDVYQIGYSYSFLQDNRIDLAAIVGLYVMPIKFGLKADGIFVAEGDVSFTAPLPVFGLRMDIALTPKWFIRTRSSLFYLEYEQFKGGIKSISGAVEYKPWKHFALGLGVDSFSLEVEADGEDYSGIDFVGNLEFEYVGLQLYAKFPF